MHADDSTSGSDRASQRPGSSVNWGPLPWSSSPQVPSFPSTSTGWQGALGSAPSLANPFSSSLLCAVPRAGLLRPPQVQVSGASPAVLNEEVLAPEDGQPGRVQGEVGHGGSASAASSAAPDDQSGLQGLLESSCKPAERNGRPNGFLEAGGEVLVPGTESKSGG